MQKLLVAAVAAIVLVLGAAVPVLALNTQAWEERRIATEAFDAAADAALDASEDAAAWTARLAEAREAAEPVLTDASAIATAAPGYFNAAVIDPLVAAVAALDKALAAEAPDGATMPRLEHPESLDGLRAGVEPLLAWADAEAERTFAVMGIATDVLDATVSAGDASRAVAETVGAEASGALGAAPLATPESRAAVEAARDAVVAAIEKTLGKPIADYATAVAALRASQQAAADAAAAAEQGSGGTDGTDYRALLEDGANDFFQNMGCVPSPFGGFDC